MTACLGPRGVAAAQKDPTCIAWAITMPNLSGALVRNSLAACKIFSLTKCFRNLASLGSEAFFYFNLHMVLCVETPKQSQKRQCGKPLQCAGGDAAHETFASHVSWWVGAARGSTTVPIDCEVTVPHHCMQGTANTSTGLEMGCLPKG
jgi:hypothetical protein